MRKAPMALLYSIPAWQANNTQMHLPQMPALQISSPLLNLHICDMPPTIHFVRHAQGLHNLGPQNEHIHDPVLTPLGEQQCRELAKRFKKYLAHIGAEVDMPVASPLRRTIHTAFLAFHDLRLPIITFPKFQEISNLRCDTGSDRSTLEAECQSMGMNVNLSRVCDGWNSKQGIWHPEHSIVATRSMKGRRLLRYMHAEHVVVVTHGGFLHYLIEDIEGEDHTLVPTWENAEFRSFRFDPSRTGTASLIETEESKKWHAARREEKPLDRAEERNLNIHL